MLSRPRITNRRQTAAPASVSARLEVDQPVSIHRGHLTALHTVLERGIDADKSAQAHEYAVLEASKQARPQISSDTRKE